MKFLRAAALASALILSLVSAPAHVDAQGTLVVTSCPAGTTIGAAGQTGRPMAIDTKGNLCMESSFVPAPASSAVTKTAVTVGTSSAQALAGATRSYLSICNESASAFVAFNLAGTAALNTAGNKTLVPYQCYEWAESFVPSDAINMIASSATTPATILSK